jgi:hypothetical protein
VSIEAYDHGKKDGVAEERERIFSILKEELKDSEETILGTKGGWREYLISKIKEERVESGKDERLQEPNL